MVSFRVARRRIASHIAQVVYGGIDGTVTTFAVVAGAYGAGLNPKVIIILGFTNLLGDGFSMGASAFASKRAEISSARKAITAYRQHRLGTEQQIEESLRHHFMTDYGFSGQLLDNAAQHAMSKEDRVVQHLLKQHVGAEIGINHHHSALTPALATFWSFVGVGAIPLLPYVLGSVTGWETGRSLFVASLACAVICFSLIGWAKSRVTSTRSWRGIFETLALGSVAAAIAYLVGDVLSQILL